MCVFVCRCVGEGWMYRDIGKPQGDVGRREQKREEKDGGAVLKDMTNDYRIKSPLNEPISCV